jgi:hypothetical protein
MEPIARDPCGAVQPLERPNYFDGKLLSIDDLRDEQQYHLEKQRWHNRHLHGRGVVCGLRVVPTDPPSPGQVIVEPGVALDGCGRDIVVPEPTLFHLGARGGADTPMGCREPQAEYVVLQYREELVEWVPVPGDPNSGEGDARAASRIRETFGLRSVSDPPEAPEDASGRLREWLQGASRLELSADQWHAALCELVSQPCTSCASDPSVPLARIGLPPCGPITSAEIDNCSDRRLALSSGLLLQVVLAAMGQRGAGTSCD